MLVYRQVSEKTGSGATKGAWFRSHRRTGSTVRSTLGTKVLKKKAGGIAVCRAKPEPPRHDKPLVGGSDNAVMHSELRQTRKFDAGARVDERAFSFGRQGGTTEGNRWGRRRRGPRAPSSVIDNNRLPREYLVCKAAPLCTTRATVLAVSMALRTSRCPRWASE